jgi:hypothetical protein
LAFESARQDLAVAGIATDLRVIGAATLQEFAKWQGRSVTWPWPEMVNTWRRGRPERFDLAVWSGSTLCGLALGRPSPGPSHLSLYYLEGNPDPAHLLQFKVARVVIAALRAYAIVLGKAEMRLVEPLPEAIPFYCSPMMGFELVTPHRQAQYCRRSTSL